MNCWKNQMKEVSKLNIYRTIKNHTHTHQMEHWQREPQTEAGRGQRPTLRSLGHLDNAYLFWGGYVIKPTDTLTGFQLPTYDVTANTKCFHLPSSLKDSSCRGTSEIRLIVCSVFIPCRFLILLPDANQRQHTHHTSFYSLESIQIIGVLCLWQ